MKDLNINRDKNQPSDEALLKHQNFDEVLQKANVQNASKPTHIASNKLWFIGGGSLFVLVLVVSTINLFGKSTSENKKSYTADYQPVVMLDKFEFNETSISNNISLITNQTETIIEKQNKEQNENVNIPNDTTKQIAYYYPKEVSTLTFKLEESFGLKEQYQQFEEFSIYDNLSFQPIGDYQSGWLKASWASVELVKKSGNYFLMLSKNGTAFPCQVIPVFESEDYVKALEDYSNANND